VAGSLLAFESLWARLAEHTHLVVAIDLPGFGYSQRRNALMSPRAMGEFIIRAADAFDQHRDSVQHLKRTTGHPHHRAPQRGPTADDWPVPLCTGGCERWPC